MPYSQFNLVTKYNVFKYTSNCYSCSFTQICVLYLCFSSLFLLHSSGLLLRTHPPSAVCVFTHFHPISFSLPLSLSLSLTLLPYSLFTSLSICFSLFSSPLRRLAHTPHLSYNSSSSHYDNLVAVSKVLDELHHVNSKLLHAIFARKFASGISSSTNKTAIIHLHVIRSWVIWFWTTVELLLCSKCKEFWCLPLDLVPLPQHKLPQKTLPAQVRLAPDNTRTLILFAHKIKSVGCNVVLTPFLSKSQTKDKKVPENKVI